MQLKLYYAMFVVVCRCFLYQMQNAYSSHTCWFVSWKICLTMHVMAMRQKQQTSNSNNFEQTVI